MERITLKTNCALALLIAGLMAAGQAAADKPSSAGSGRGERGERGEHREDSDRRHDRRRDDGERGRHGGRESSVRTREHFHERHRIVVHEFFSDEFRRGRCPPGLARKHNGCMPPGQVRTWVIGRPLPPDVIFFAVPPPLVVQFGPPPSGHRYVRVAGDILLIALGTGLVVDAIQDLGRM